MEDAHDLPSPPPGFRGFVLDEAPDSPDREAALREALRLSELIDRRRAQRRVLCALVGFWSLVAFAAFVVWRVNQAPDASEIRSSEAWDDEPREPMDEATRAAFQELIRQSGDVGR